MTLLQRLALGIVSSAVLAACGSQSGIPTTPSSPPPATGSNPGRTSVRIEGVVLDGDRDEPLAGVVVKIVSVDSPRSPEVEPGWSAIADVNGAFGFAADLPSDWRELLLEGSGPGYERNGTGVTSATVASAVLKLQPTLTIPAGESLHTRVLRSGYTCFFEGWPCRRVFVEAPSGESVDMEVIGGDETVGLQAGPLSTHPFEPALDRRATVPSGEVWIYGGKNEPWTAVMLTATRH